MFARVRYFFSDLAFWIRGHLGRALLGLTVVAGAVLAAVLAAGQLGGEDEPAPAPAPEVIVRTEQAPEEASDLGFPAFATSNTTRVGGADPVATAAGVALATFPAGGSVAGPDAVSLVDAGDWATAIAAAPLIAEPVGAPILFSEGEDLPELTEDALAALAPAGSRATGGAQVFAIGSAPEPDDLQATAVEGSGAAQLAAEVADLRRRLSGEDPEHVLIASSDDPAFAMPAAAWAARSGDPVLFAQADSVPSATLDALERLQDVPVYLLGGEDVISADAEEEIADATNADVTRATDERDPVAGAVEFARYVDGAFGWNINDPGHGFVIVNSSRPADAAAAAPLSGSGTWGPMLLTDEAGSPPADLEGYLLDLKPGFVDDPTRAVYNHLWIIGDESAVSVDFQVEVDEIAEVARITGGSGDSLLEPPEQETDQPPRGSDRGDDAGQDGDGP